MNKRAQFTARLDFSQIVGKREVVFSSIGPSGEAVLLALEPKYAKEPFGRDERKGGSFPLSKARRNYPAVFIRVDRNVIQETELTEVESAFPFVQPLPDGEILIVGARCHFRKGNPEQNAAVYSPQGVLLRQFVLGDGINGVQTTREGMIWVSYCDEGVFGNLGWEKPVGAAGLLCFDRNGQMVWEFQAPDSRDAIADCYAFNVCHDAVWTCYYTDFPLVRIDSQKHVRAWKNEVAGASAMAVHRQHVLLWGGYGDKRSRCVLQRIEDEKLVDQTELDLVAPIGLDTTTAIVTGRGGVLHAFSGNNWLTLDMAEESFKV